MVGFKPDTDLIFEVPDAEMLPILQDMYGARFPPWILLVRARGIGLRLLYGACF
jgi:hypothetical protein